MDSFDPPVPVNKEPTQLSSALRKRCRLSRVSLNMTRNRARRRFTWRPSFTFVKHENINTSQSVSNKEVPLDDSVKNVNSSNSFSAIEPTEKDSTASKVECIDEKNEKSESIQELLKDNVIQDDSALKEHVSDTQRDDDSDQEVGYIILDEAGSFDLDPDCDENILEESTNLVVEAGTIETNSSSLPDTTDPANNSLQILTTSNASVDSLQQYAIEEKTDADKKEDGLKLSSSSCIQTATNTIECQEIQSINKNKEADMLENEKESNLTQMFTNDKKENKEAIIEDEAKLVVTEIITSVTSDELDKSVLNETSPLNCDEKNTQSMEIYKPDTKLDLTISKIYSDMPNEASHQNEQKTEIKKPLHETTFKNKSEIVDKSENIIGNTGKELPDNTSDQEDIKLLECISSNKSPAADIDSDLCNQTSEKKSASICNSTQNKLSEIQKESKLPDIFSDPEDIDSWLDGISSDEGDNDESSKITEKSISNSAEKSNKKDVSENVCIKVSETISDPDDETDSWLEGIISSDEDDEPIDKNAAEKPKSAANVSIPLIKPKLEKNISDEPGKSSTLLGIPCVSESSEKLDFFLKTTPTKRRAASEDSEDIDRALEGMDMEDNEKEKNKTEKLFDEASDDGSLKDGIDIDSVLLDDDEDELVLEKIVQKKYMPPEISEVIELDDDEEPKTETVNIIDDAMEQDIDKIEKNICDIKKEKDLLEIECTNNDKKIEESESNFEKEVRSVLHVLCNIISLQADQISTSERIAVMESVLQRTNEDPELPAESERSLTPFDNCPDIEEVIISDKTTLKRVNNDFEETSHERKRLKFADQIPQPVINLEDSPPNNSMSIKDSRSISSVDSKYKIENKAEVETKINNPKEVLTSPASINPSVGSTDDEANITKCSIGKVKIEKDGLYLVEPVESVKGEKTSQDKPVVNSSVAAAPIGKVTVGKNLLLIKSKFCAEESSKVSQIDKSEADVNQKIETSRNMDWDKTESSPDTNLSFNKEKINSELDVSLEVPPSLSKKRIASTEESSRTKAGAKKDGENSSLNGMVNGDYSEDCLSKRQKTSSNENIAQKDKLDADVDDHLLKVCSDSDMSVLWHMKVLEFTAGTYGSTVSALREERDRLKKVLFENKKTTETVRNQMREVALKQNSQFKQFLYDPKLERRTVGVNVKIVPQPDIRARTYSNMNQTIPPPKQHSSSGAPSPVGIQSIVNNARNILPMNIQQIRPLTTVTPIPAPGTTKMQLLVSNNSSLKKSIVNFPSVSASTPGPSRTPAPNVVVMTNAPISSTSSKHQVVDLTDDESPAQRPNITIPSKVMTSGQLPAKGLVTPPNMLQMPIMPPLMQLLPPGSMASSPTDINTLRIRSPGNLSPATRMTWTVPLLRPVTGSPPRLVNVSPPQGMRQPLQTLIIAPMGTVMTTSGQVATSSRSNPINSTVASFATTTTTPALAANSQLTLTRCYNSQHPAPLPPSPNYAPSSKLKNLPPKPSLKMSKVSTGIVLSWNMNVTPKHADISSYQLYAYQENAGPVSYLLWKKVGDIKALPLPMACTLTHFVEGHKYHFTVRAIDVYKRAGPFSEATSILLVMQHKSGEASTSQIS